MLISFFLSLSFFSYIRSLHHLLWLVPYFSWRFIFDFWLLAAVLLLLLLLPPPLAAHSFTPWILDHRFCYTITHHHGVSCARARARPRLDWIQHECALLPLLLMLFALALCTNCMHRVRGISFETEWGWTKKNIFFLSCVHNIIGTDSNLAAAYVSAGLPQFATSALSTPSALGNVGLQSAAGNALIGKQIEGKCANNT